MKEPSFTQCAVCCSPPGFSVFLWLLSISPPFPTFEINVDQNYPKPGFQEGVDFHRTKHLSFIGILVNYINS